MSSVTPSFSTFCPLSNLYGPRKCLLEVMGNFTRAASSDERLRLTLGIQRYPELGSCENRQARRTVGSRKGAHAVDSLCIRRSIRRVQWQLSLGVRTERWPASTRQDHVPYMLRLAMPYALVGPYPVQLSACWPPTS
jgi:hypothetical protein